MEKTIPKIEKILVNFDEVVGNPRRLVGGKGTSLASMYHGGLPVPPGFVVTTDAYRKLNGHALPKIVVDELLSAFDRLGAERVAVRSSAVAEDAANASWAGQFETVLNVTRDQLGDAIQLCWDSANSDKVAGYARNNKVKEEALALGVVVQAMIDSDVAGVVFTKNPILGTRDEIMIEACFGLGELLVQGIITPDNFTLRRESLTVKSSNHYEQQSYLTYNHGKNIELPVPDPDAQKLSLDQVIKLAELALKVEYYFGDPQDIEWALQKETFFVVQARPITT